MISPFNNAKMVLAMATLFNFVRKLFPFAKVCHMFTIDLSLALSTRLTCFTESVYLILIGAFLSSFFSFETLLLNFYAQVLLSYLFCRILLKLNAVLCTKGLVNKVG